MQLFLKAGHKIKAAEWFCEAGKKKGCPFCFGSLYAVRVCNKIRFGLPLFSGVFITSPEFTCPGWISSLPLAYFR